MKLRRLFYLRTENDLLQKHLAEYLGITQQSYARYEVGKAEPSVTTLIRLARFYDTSVDYIIGLTDERQPYKRT